jgi:hypothetical protein
LAGINGPSVQNRLTSTMVYGTAHLNRFGAMSALMPLPVLREPR